jgi:hypothetical protein
MLPAVAHLVILSLAMGGVIGPAVWISDRLLVGTWSVAVLWAVVIGGPLLSAIAGLTLELWPGETRLLGRACGLFACALLILGLITTVPFPWILAFEK